MLFYIALGLVVGSFLNLCIDRLPRGQSIISPPSLCDACHRRLSVVDLVPVFSYLFLKGRCRSCGVAISLRMPLVELTTGGAFGLLWWWLGPGVKLALASFYTAVLVLITVIDLEHHVALNRVVYPAIALAPVAALAYGLGLGESLMGGAVGFSLLFVPYFAYRGGLGAGDVKLGALVGAINGFPAVLVALFLAVVFGGVASVFLLLTGVKGRKDPIPFAPFLLLGTAFAFVCGRDLVKWYLQLW